jgi:predicted nucleic acid-binding Zn ribbon protein
MSTCLHCGKEIPTSRKFCGHSCRAVYFNTGRKVSTEQRLKTSNTAKQNRPRKVRKCIVCGGSFVPKYNTRKTCSDECRKVCCGRGGINALKTLKCGRSKNEVMFFSKVREVFPGAIANPRMFDGYDADIVIPELRLAIHWNGPLHYRPLFAMNHFKEIQRKDKQRYEAVETAGYTNYIIDDRNNRGMSIQKVEDEFNLLLTRFGTPGGIRTPNHPHI